MKRYPPHGLPEHDPRIYYFNKGESVQNFGDYLPELMALEMMGHPRIQADVYALVGSVIDPSFLRRIRQQALDRNQGRIAAWACGARSENPLPASVSHELIVCGTRGPLTRDLLGLPPSTPIGDPGLLAALYHTPEAHPETTGKTICIPHVHDQQSFAEILRETGADLCVNPVVEASEAGLREILDKIASADFVLSGSLHGAIIACAYERPFAFWSTGHVDAPFKWRDFAASVGIESEFARDRAAGEKLYRDKIEPRLARPPLVPVLDCCPFAIKPSTLLRAMVLDGALDAHSGAAAQAVFAGLESERIETIHAMQDAASALRSSWQSLEGYLERSGAVAKVRAKRTVASLLEAWMTPERVAKLTSDARTLGAQTIARIRPRGASHSQPPAN